MIYPSDTSSTKCTDTTSIPLAPGDKITSTGKCHGTARGGYCRGKNIGEACEYQFDCDVGLTCGIQKTCVKAAEAGQYCNDEDMMCKSYLYCRENICIKYGSVKDNFNPGKNDPDLCESHHLHRGVCAVAPKLDGKIFVEHTEDICDYTNGDHEPAQCGFHKNGKAICKPGDGDLVSEWKDVLKFLERKPECNSYISHLSICDYAEVQVGRDYVKAAVGYWRLHNFVELQENADCVKPYTNPKYFDLLAKYNSATTLSVFFGLLLTILLLI